MDNDVLEGVIFASPKGGIEKSFENISDFKLRIQSI
jgi:hypothetical protein